MSNVDYIIERFLKYKDNATEDEARKQISAFRAYLRKEVREATNGDRRLSMGKYKTMTLKEIYVIDMPYLRYVYRMPNISTYVFEDVKAFLASVYSEEEMDKLDEERRQAREDVEQRERNDVKRRRIN